jgi:hypothetical protein
LFYYKTKNCSDLEHCAVTEHQANHSTGVKQPVGNRASAKANRLLRLNYNSFFWLVFIDIIIVICQMQINEYRVGNYLNAKGELGRVTSISGDIFTGYAILISRK